MTHYLDPKNDLIFKRIFGEHPHLLTSFLNALLHLESDQMIEYLQYQPSEQFSENRMRKNTIISANCINREGRQFIVETQIFWNSLFKNRIIYNASTAYVRQAGENVPYNRLLPVYSLGIINDVFDYKTDAFYHSYQSVNCTGEAKVIEVIDAMKFMIIELPKFNSSKWTDGEMATLWLRFLREVEDQTYAVSSDLLKHTEIREALALCEKDSLTPEELQAYEQYWDYVREERGLAGSTESKARLAERERIIVIAYQNQFSIQRIAAFSELEEDYIRDVLKRHNCLDE